MQRGSLSQAMETLMTFALVGVAGFSIGKATSPILDIKAGDWLSFAGAVSGVVLAIGGAIWIEDRKRLRERMEEFEMLTQSLALVGALFQYVRFSETEGKDDRYVALVCMQARTSAREAAAALQLAKKSTIIKSIRLMVTIQELENVLASDALATRPGDNIEGNISGEAISRAQEDYAQLDNIAERVLELIKRARLEFSELAEAKLI